MLPHQCFRFALLMMLFPVFSSQAGVLPSREKIDGALAHLGADDKHDNSKTIDWGILPGPFYTPELGVGVGVAAVGLYRPDPNDLETQISSVSMSGFFSSTGAFGLGVTNYSFLDKDRWRVFVNGSINNVPTYYWGEGYRAGKSSNTKEGYTAKDATLSPILYYRVAPDTYIGAGWTVSSMHATQIKDRQKGSFDRANGGASVFSSGASASFSYDTRDFVPNPTRGQVLQVTYTYFSPSLGSNNRFSVLENQYSLYHSLNVNTVLAWDIYGRFTQGNVPWNMMSELGSDHRMRGYYQGRYRDRDVVNTQLEYRRKLSWRHGVVGWVGTGNMADGSKHIGKGEWLPSVGVGYRFEFKPRMNVRLDYGIGKRSSGFYFQVGEAF